MALLVRVLRNRISQWVPVCSLLVPVSSTQAQWGRALSGTFQWPQISQSLACGGSEQIPGIDVQWNRKYHTTNKLFTTKDSPQPVEEKVGTFTKIIEAMGFTGPLKYSKWDTDKLECTQKWAVSFVNASESVLNEEWLKEIGMLNLEKRRHDDGSSQIFKIKIAALRMYTSCVEKTDFEEFFLRCQMPDTFNSWFLITLLHVWMCLVRMKQEGRSGKYMCRIIVHFMWEDVEQRGRVMGVNSYILKKNMILMTNNFYAAILGYDEGILSDDHGLAAALWRTFFNQKCEDPRQLELLVEYVRKQMQYLDSMNGEDLLLTGEVSWRPLVEKNPQSVLKPHSPTYNDEGL
ncbi:ubiquinol-cytochrome-c reductase complex assembly factor 1 isoform X3 [Panthera leo]|uniref:ubiquinol-cytochrome-c reductase complex assembly factor 1 isoform X3 n=1 Tax=Panthera leo TaxID=9689 RepID=UPI001C696F01|nr:ubiquinol-cytochrome-c reductase complex assembly factor 1 isoform X3 [Panthera leo]